jgi:hypothetical protein
LSLALLCGQDGFSGQNFEHREEWAEKRLLEPARWTRTVRKPRAR